MTLLFVTTIMPGGRTTGSEVASAAFVDALRAGGERTIVMGYRRSGDAPALAPDDVVVADRHIETSHAGAWPLLWLGAAAVRGLPYSVAKYASRGFAAALHGVVERERPRVVVLDHAQMAWALPPGGFGRPFVHVAHNVEHRLYAEAAATGAPPRRLVNAREARLIERAERRLCAEAAAVWTLTADDAAALGRFRPDRAPAPRAFALPAGAEAVGRAAAGGDAQPGHDVGLLGTWTWGPNAAGLSWFAESVRPALPSGVSVAVAGAGGERLAEGMDYRGRVPDAGAFLRSARVVAVPSVAGSGIQIKTLDAIAAGRPVVATSVALRGIDDPPPSVRVADEPLAFARAIEAALADGADSGPAAREWVERRRTRFDADVAEALAEAAG